MVDNFSKISECIKSVLQEIPNEYSSNDVYFHCQIIRRSKDNNGEGSNSRLIKAFQIDSEHPIEHYEEHIKKMCEDENARAYINLSPKSKHQTAVRMLNELADCFQKNDFNYLNRLWNSAAGKVGAIRKLWVIDVDYEDGRPMYSPSHLKWYIDNECEPLNGESKIFADIPTKNGMHIITRPFNLQKFKLNFPVIDVHKNNPTVLYVPDTVINKN